VYHSLIFSSRRLLAAFFKGLTPKVSLQLSRHDPLQSQWLTSLLLTASGRCSQTGLLFHNRTNTDPRIWKVHVKPEIHMLTQSCSVLAWLLLSVDYVVGASRVVKIKSTTHTGK